MTARGALALLCLAVVALLGANVLLHGPMVDLDQDVSHWMTRHHQAWLTPILYVVTELHQTTVVLAATVLLAFWLGAVRQDWDGARTLLVVPAAMLLNVGLKNLLQRARPAWDDPIVQLATYSFPSGHAVAATVFYGSLCAVAFAHTRSPLWRGVAATMTVLMVLLVSFTRVYLGAHYPSDVIAGIATGTLCLLAAFRLARR